MLLEGFGGGPVIVPFQYKDGWFYSAGCRVSVESADCTARRHWLRDVAGDRSVRAPYVPDNDRTWLSIGGTYKYSAKVTFDLAYSHVFVKNAPINITDPSNPFFTTRPAPPIPALSTSKSTSSRWRCTIAGISGDAGAGQAGLHNFQVGASLKSKQEKAGTDAGLFRYCLPPAENQNAPLKVPPSISKLSPVM